MTAIEKRYRAPNQLSPEREQALVDAALAVFAEKGLAGASMDMIARRAGVTKVTIYRRYRDKYALFETVMEDAARSMAARFEMLDLDPREPEQSLRRAAVLLLRHYDQEKHLGVGRLMVAESGRYPELCTRARNVVVASLAGKLIDFFKTLIARGQMAHNYPREAATTFVLVFSQGFRPLLNARGSEEEQARQFEADFLMFMRGYGICAEPATKHD